MTSVLTVGSTTVDFVFHVDVFPSTAEKHKAKDAEIVGGGCAVNAAAAIIRLGGKSYLAADIGDDQLADIIVDELVKIGVDTGLVRRTKGGRSSFSSVLVSSDGERMILNYRGQGLNGDAEWLNSAPQVDAILVDSRWPEGAAVALDIATQRNIPGIIDVEIGVDLALLGKATHLAFSAQGLRSIYPGISFKEALKNAAIRYKTWACVTDGEHGVLFTNGVQVDHIKAFEVVAVDTLGAGDIWHGAFALMLAEGAIVESAIIFANATAALKCTKHGGRSAIPDRKSVNKFLTENEHAAYAG